MLRAFTPVAEPHSAAMAPASCVVMTVADRGGAAVAAGERARHREGRSRRVAELELSVGSGRHAEEEAAHRVTRR